jgi:hypothetical protein
LLNTAVYTAEETADIAALREPATPAPVPISDWSLRAIVVNERHTFSIQPTKKHPMNTRAHAVFFVSGVHVATPTHLVKIVSGNIRARFHSQAKKIRANVTHPIIWNLTLPRTVASRPPMISPASKPRPTMLASQPPYIWFPSAYKTATIEGLRRQYDGTQ